MARSISVWLTILAVVSLIAGCLPGDAAGVRIVAPADGRTVMVSGANTASIVVELPDDWSAEQVELYIDGALLGTGVGDTVFPWPLAGVSAGDCILRAVVPGRTGSEAEAISIVRVEDSTALPLAEREWTYLVYLAADNTLDYYGFLDLAEMTAVGSSRGVNVVVQHDSRAGTAKRFYITQNARIELADLGETNTGNQTTLQDFLVWGIQNFPARRYALVLWSHGSGVYDAPYPSVITSVLPAAGFTTQAVAVDDTSGKDALTTMEYSGAIRSACAATGVRLDVLCFDACLMQMVEVGTELVDAAGAPLADYLVASPEVVPGPGLDYGAILSWLVEEETADGLSLARKIVGVYAAAYADVDTTISALDLAGADWPELQADLADLAALLAAADPAVLARVKEIARVTAAYDYTENKDLRDFVRGLRQSLSDQAEIAAAAYRIELLLGRDRTLASMANTGDWKDGHAGGLAILLPTTDLEWSRYPDYGNLRLAQTTSWDEFLAAMLAAP